MKTTSILCAFAALAALTLSCSTATTAPQPTVTPARVISPAEPPTHTLRGFFPSPPQVTIESVLALYRALGEHGDVVLLQNEPDWTSFLAGVEGESEKRTDIANQVTLAHQQNLDAIFVADPLNGLNRREFAGLPFGWTASFGDPQVRQAFTNYALWLTRTFKPRYLGLGSEINTYADAHPEDFPNYVSLYREIYGLIKAESPDTQVFVTFQWEDLNNLIPDGAEGRVAYATNWDQVEVFEPELDLWVISTYPFVAFDEATSIPADYYTPLLTRTDKPLAVAEGGIPTHVDAPILGSEQAQVDYLNAVNEQVGPRLTFWIYLLLADLDPESWNATAGQNGMSNQDLNTLGWFMTVGLTGVDGSPKPALATWDAIRAEDGP